MSEFRIKFRPNWLPELTPPLFDLTERLIVDAVPSVRESVQRRETPNVLVYSDFSLSFTNYDRALDPLFDLDLIQGTDPANLRAPLLHYGVVYIADREFGGTEWRNSIGFVDPRSVRLDNNSGTVTVTAYSPAKLLEKGNAERVHRFSDICAPSPYALFPFDLLAPAIPPGGTVPSPEWLTLVGAAGRQFFPGDIISVVQKITPATYSEGMDTVELSPSGLIIRTTSVSGADLLIQATDEDGNAAEGLFLTAGQATLVIENPWFHGVQYRELISRLVDEANAALASAGYPDALSLVVDSADIVLSSPALDLIDNNGIPQPLTGAGYYSDGGAARRLALASGSTGVAKPDILLDPVLADRSFNVSLYSPGFTLFGGGGISRSFIGPSVGAPFTYANPAGLGLAPGNIANAPAIIQERTTVESDNKLSDTFALTPASFASSPVSLKTGYICMSFDVFATLAIGGKFPGDPVTRIRRGFNLSQMQTTTNGAAWALVGAKATSQFVGVQPEEYSPARIAGEANGFIRIFPVAGGFLFLIVDAGRGRGFYYFSAIDTPTPAAIIAGMTQFGDFPGNRSGAVLFPGNVPVFFNDRGIYEFTGSGTVDLTNGLAAVAGTGTAFLTDFVPGDILSIPSLDGSGKALGVVLSVASNTSLTLTAPYSGPTDPAAIYYIRKAARGVSMYYWSGAAMLPGTMSGFPALNGGDFAGANYDAGRGRLYLVIGSSLQSFAVTLLGSILTATLTVSAPLDSLNSRVSADSAAVEGTGPAVNRPNALAWLCGPVDVIQGTPPDTANYPAASHAMIVATTTAVYIFSDTFGGIVAIADFEGLSCSAAIAQLAQLPHQLVASGPDSPTTLDPAAYFPTPTIFIRGRIPVGPPSIDLSSFAATANVEPWIIQNGSVRVSNPKNEALGSIRNDASFNFAGVIYKVAAARYGGANALRIENNYVGTTSVGKAIANSSAFEFLIPRPSARIKCRDPFSVYGTAASILRALTIVRYLARGPDNYAPAVILTGRVLSVSFSLKDDLVDLEIA